jgi:hypothetical protein
MRAILPRKVSRQPDNVDEPTRRPVNLGEWAALAVLAAAQFLMVLDQAVMNVSISQLVSDFDTTVTVIQA